MDAVIKYVSENLKDHNILSKQMLEGGWLQERLTQNLREDHGIENTGTAKISIPFLANEVPSEESEFSDPYVLTINTFIAYLSRGLDLEQTIKMHSIVETKSPH